MKIKLLLIISLVTIFCSCKNEGIKDEQDNPVNIAKEFDVHPSTFNIQTDKDTILFGKSGTAIFIEANSLEYNDGTKPTSEIKVVLKEYYLLSEMLTKNLTTMSNEGLLETGGMININMFSDERQLKLKTGKNIVVHFPKNGTNLDMKLFSEAISEELNSSVRWIEEKKSVGHEIDTITPFIIKYDDLDSEYMILDDGTNIWTWLKEEIVLTEEERNYVRLRDFDIKFIVSKNGNIKDVQLEKKYKKKESERLLSIISNMPKIRPFKRNGNEIDMESWVNFAVKYIPAEHISNEAYLKSIEKNYPDFGSKSINDISQIDLNYYIFSSAKLGWLNCDHFVDDPAKKINITLKEKSDENLMIKFIYKDYKSIITPMYIEGVNYFNGIPENKDFTLLIIKSKRNKIQMSITEHTTTEGEITGINYKDYTMDQIKTELEKLN